MIDDTGATNPQVSSIGFILRDLAPRRPGRAVDQACPTGSVAASNQSTGTELQNQTRPSPGERRRHRPT
eukprot:5434436-Pleurochrysis_carterae.AAC.1